MSEQPQPRRTRRSGIGTGTTSLLMIFTLLCLATLALLSLTTARSDNRIKQRGVEANASLLAAEGDAAQGLAYADYALEIARVVTAEYGEEYYYEIALTSLQEYGFAVNEQNALAGFAVQVDDTNVLYTILRVLPYSSTTRYELVSQSTESTYDWQPATEGGVWQGD